MRKQLYFGAAASLVLASSGVLHAGDPVRYVPINAPAVKNAKSAPIVKGATGAKKVAATKPPGKPAPKIVTPPINAPRPERLEVFPEAIQLNSRRAYRQFVVTAYFGGEARDVTRGVTMQVADAKIARVENGLVTARGDGKTSLTISFTGKSLKVPVQVAHSGAPEPIRFKTETIAALTKQGCSAGSCHGSPHGKGGFSLSLFGYDPRIDKISLVRDGFNRRVDVMKPEESLMLKKPLLQVSHGGGKRLRKNDTAYHLLRDWIYEGANVDLPDVECKGIEVHPGAARVLKAPFLQQQIGVVASFSDGSVRDVSAIATYESSHPTVVAVDADGLVTGRNRGQAAISVRYLNALQSLYVTVIEDVPGFQWNNPPAANLVDRLVNDKLKQLQYLPSGPCRDEEFIRRVYLDLTGLLPPPDKARDFLKDQTFGKRAAVIEALLGSEEYARFQALKKADLMRVSPRVLKGGRAETFARWIVDEMRRNVPHDRFARAILTASGDTKKDAPANYYLAITDEKERAEMTSQIFMGSRIECAKCHNHPFENWTMRDYYSLSAVFARTRVDRGTIKLALSGDTSLPTTGEKMTPWGLTDAKTQAKEDRRALFADWLTKPDNPLFARVEVNRIWADLMGRGIVEPVDDFRSSNPPSNVPLLDTLAQEFIKSGYDRKHIMRLICNSNTYQRTTQTNKFNASDEMLFSHARARLLNAEQMRDAIKMSTRVLPAMRETDANLFQAREQAKVREAELEGKYEAWLVAKHDEVGKAKLWAGGWSLAGPFKHDNFDKAATQVFAPEQFPVDLAARFDGGLSWQVRTDLADDKMNAISDENNQVHYLYRRAFSAEAQSVTAQLDAKEAAMVWLNGKLLTDKPLRGNKPVKLDLQAGDNALLIKIINGGNDAGFSFRFNDEKIPKFDMPPHAVEILSLAAEQRSVEQKRLLHEAYLDADDRLRGLRSQIVRYEDRLDYATQRPFPEISPFAIAFGQPQRETACTCERQNAPTLMQALELLNGDTAFKAASAGADTYAKLDNDKMIEELYLSALSRFPTVTERLTMQRFLEKSKDRNTGIADLLWTIVNTREFLFQH